MKDNTISTIKDSTLKSKHTSRRRKTPHCPKCGQEIRTLIYSSTVTTLGEYSLTAGIEEDPATGETQEEEYSCTECGETLFKDEEEAELFLRGRGR